MKKHTVLLLVVAGIFMLGGSVALGLWLAYYQPSEVVIRKTFVDGRVEVIGGRTPWRRPDFVAYGSHEDPIIVTHKDGSLNQLRRVEVWLRDKSDRDKLKEVFRLLWTKETEQGAGRN